jgi:hypothetical protein
MTIMLAIVLKVFSGVTRRSLYMTAQEIVGEQTITHEVCQASIEAARAIWGQLETEFQNPESVLYDVVALRAAGMPAEQGFGLTAMLLTDPARSRVVVERYRIQAGELPSDATVGDPEAMLSIWAAESRSIPKLKIPEGREPAVMELADKAQMRGGGPVIFSREQAADMVINPKTKFIQVGAANKANCERVKTVLALHEAHRDYSGSVIATVDPQRRLKDSERANVEGFAPEATNELELLIDSALAEGFVASDANRYGVRILPDGSMYTKLHYPADDKHPNGVSLLVLAPKSYVDATGKPQTGVYNAYRFLSEQGGKDLLGADFDFRLSDLVHVTSSHYGPMSIANNLLAVDDLCTTIGSLQVIGDNQAARTPQAHLVEIGLVTDKLGEALSRPALQAVLLAAA